MKRISAREIAGAKPLNGEAIRRVVLPLFRRRNDYSSTTLDELPAELGKFGITTVKGLRLLMKRHRRSLLADENIRMSRAEISWLSNESGAAGIDAFAGKSWYAVPGLVRQAMELEFGEAAAVYAAAPEV